MKREPPDVKNISISCRRTTAFLSPGEAHRNRCKRQVVEISMMIVGNVTENVTPVEDDIVMFTRRRRWALIISFVVLLGAGLTFPFWWNAWLERAYAPTIHALPEAPSGRVALVLGARVYPNGNLSGMLADRVDTAIALYKAGKVDRLLLSGDNSSDDYNEPGAMAAYAIKRGVPAEAIQPDYGGRRTYDSCYRARHIFLVEEVIVVTQAFHLPRALYLCENLGLEVEGVIADRRVYSPRSLAWSEMREMPASVAALLDVMIRPLPPVMGEPIPLQ